MTTTDAAIQDIETVLYDGASMRLEDRVTLAHDMRELCDEVLGDLEHDLAKEKSAEATHERYEQQARHF
jgi:hypothetical protein